MTETLIFSNFVEQRAMDFHGVQDQIRWFDQSFSFTRSKETQLLLTEFEPK